MDLAVFIFDIYRFTTKLSQGSLMVWESRFYELVFCGTGGECEFGVKAVDFEEVPVRLPAWRGRTVIPDLPETVFALHCLEGKRDDGGLFDLLRYDFYEFHVPRQPVNEPPATGGVRVIADNGERLCYLRVHAANFNLRGFILTISGVCAGQDQDRNFYSQVLHSTHAPVQAT